MKAILSLLMRILSFLVMLGSLVTIESYVLVATLGTTLDFYIYVALVIANIPITCGLTLLWHLFWDKMAEYEFWSIFN